MPLMLRRSIYLASNRLCIVRLNPNDVLGIRSIDFPLVLFGLVNHYLAVLLDYLDNFAESSSVTDYFFWRSLTLLIVILDRSIESP
jgi:hypothetical protein